MADVLMNDTPFRRQGTIDNEIARENEPTGIGSQLVFGIVTANNTAKGTINYALSATGQTVGEARVSVFNYGSLSSGNKYGYYHPIGVGSRVLIGFVDGDTTQGVVIGVVPPTGTDYSIYTPKVFDGDNSNRLSEKIVYPSQQSILVSQNGEFTRTFDGYSFFHTWSGTSDLPLYQNASKYDSGILSGIGTEEKPMLDAFYKSDGETELPINPQAQNWDLVHESNSDIDTHKTRFFINQFGEFNMALFDRDTDDAHIVNLDVDRADGFKLIKAVDFDHSIDTSNCKNYTEFSLNDDQTISILYHNDKKETGVKVTSDGTYIDGVLVAAKNSLEDLTEKFKQLTTDFNNLNTKITSLGSDFFTKLRDDVTKLQNSSGSLTQQVIELGNSVSDNQNQISSVNKTATSNTQAILDLNNTISGINGNDGTLTKLSSKVDSISNKLPASGTIETKEDFSKQLGSYLTVDTFNTYKNSVGDTYVLKSDYDKLNTQYQDLVKRVTALESKVK